MLVLKSRVNTAQTASSLCTQALCIRAYHKHSGMQWPFTSSNTGSGSMTSGSTGSWRCQAPYNCRCHQLWNKIRPVKVYCTSGGAHVADEDADGDDDVIKPGTPLRVERLLSNLGYGKRKECALMIKRKRLLFAETGQAAKVGEKALPGQLLLDGEPLDPGPPLTLLLHKPAGYVVTSPEDEAISDPKIYDLLPFRFGRRKPFLSAVGRLDKDTSGLLILTDDGQLLHSIQSPVKGIWKRYTAKLAAPLDGKEADKAVQRFASGQMQLQGDLTPLLPAALHMLDSTTAEVAICEGRYHQVKRMFAAVGHTVVQLHRHAIGGLFLQPELGLGQWRLATKGDLDKVMSGPESWDAVQQETNETGKATEASHTKHDSNRAPAEAGHTASKPGGDADSRKGQASSRPLSSTGSSEGPQAAGESSNTSSTRRYDSLEADDDADWEEDVDHPGEVAAAAKRFQSTSKRARRRAFLRQTVRLLQQQPRELEQ